LGHVHQLSNYDSGRSSQNLLKSFVESYRRRVFLRARQDGLVRLAIIGATACIGFITLENSETKTG
jgi:hypothetical protein